MKKFLITILLCLSTLLSKSQNGGQFFENNVIKVFYLGYSSGTHTFRVCNKQNCEARIRTKADQDPAIDIQVSADSCVIVSVDRPTPNNVKFRAKSETSCPNFTNPDMGWLELNTADFVLNLMENNNVTIIRGPNKLKISVVNGIYSSDFGNLNYKEQIWVYDIYGHLRYKSINFINKKNKIDLSNHLINGINFIQVLIESNSVDKITLKYFK